MATTVEDTLFIPDSAEMLRDDLLTDFRLECRKFGVTQPSVAVGTDNWLFFTAVANAGMLQYANIASVRPSITPLFSQGPDLENWRDQLGLPVVSASPASGKLTVTVSGGSTVTIPANTQFILPNGKRGRTSGAHLGVVDESDVSVIMIDTGTASNAVAGTKVRWVNPPFNVATEARVSVNEPLTGGLDAETEARKRARVLNRLGNTPGGGNWGHAREVAFNELATVQDCYPFPALGGPASAKVTIIKAFDPVRNDFTRAFSSAAVEVVRNAIHRELPSPMEIVIGTVTEEPVDVAVSLDIPDSSLAGGNGLGWTDQEPWPSATNLVSGRVQVTTVTSSTAIRVTTTAATTDPIAGQTHIMWWSRNDQQFRVFLIVEATETGAGTGVWDIELDKPLVDSDGEMVQVGDFVSPATQGYANYRETFLTLMGELGAGENTALAALLPRSKRHPFVEDGGAPIGITNAWLAQLIEAHNEITDASFTYRSATAPTVPASVDDNPNVLTPRHFGIYPQ
jgi:uncharacterized phage protein gp47/JayE